MAISRRTRCPPQGAARLNHEGGLRLRRPGLTDTPAAAVEIEGVSKRFGRTLALDNVSFEVRSNELFALLGPNGAGKTTLLHILCTILRPDSGTARINGADVIRIRSKGGDISASSSRNRVSTTGSRSTRT